MADSSTKGHSLEDCSARGTFQLASYHQHFDDASTQIFEAILGASDACHRKKPLQFFSLGAS